MDENQPIHNMHGLPRLGGLGRSSLVSKLLKNLAAKLCLGRGRGFERKADSEVAHGSSKSEGKPPHPKSMPEVG